jgi:3D (Asp-Asp-Asp) domain-containing protein
MRFRLIPLLLLLVPLPVFVGACLFVTPSADESRPAVWPKDISTVTPVPVYELPVLEHVVAKEEVAPVIINKELDGLTVVSADPMPTSISGVKTVTKSEVVERDYDIVRMVVRAYCPCVRCCSPSRGITSTQTNAWKPGLAVSPKIIGYGTKIVVPGYNNDEPVYADDTGPNTGRDRRGRPLIEVRTVYHWQARDWGRQILDVKVYRAGN